MHIDQGEILRVQAEGDQLCDDEPGPQKIVEGVGAEHKGSVALHYNVIVSLFFFVFRVSEPNKKDIA
jgi:DNA-directed RNA polymerase III subunit RPC8